MAVQFFYDAQIRRFMIQFARMFSGFQVEYGKDPSGVVGNTLVRVPVRYGDASRNAQTILQENSANNMPSAPLMSFYITGLDYDRPRMQDPYYTSNIAVRQRTYDQATNTYEQTQGNAFNIERYMPVPYKLSMTLDIWTSNTNQKFQILEQVLPLFNPALEIQSTDNYLDWTSLSIVELDGVTFSSRSIPIGTEDPIDVCTLKFVLPIWLSLPAKVKKLGVVEQIIASIFDGNGDMVNAIKDNDLLLGTRQRITPFGYQVILIGNKLQILRQFAVSSEPSDLQPLSAVTDSNVNWSPVIDIYGVLRPGISMITLTQGDGSEVMGTVSLDPTNNQFLLFSIITESIPPNTLLPVDAVINPLLSGPSYGLPAATAGQSYLLTEDTGSQDSYAVAWTGTSGEPLVARANDIIEYDGTRWLVAFDSVSAAQDTQYVTNITTEIQYKWTGEQWVKSYQGLYAGGEWTLII